VPAQHRTRRGHEASSLVWRIAAGPRLCNWNTMPLNLGTDSFTVSATGRPIDLPNVLNPRSSANEMVNFSLTVRSTEVWTIQRTLRNVLGAVADVQLTTSDRRMNCISYRLKMRRDGLENVMAAVILAFPVGVFGPVESSHPNDS
jgi:hypothetical protein